MKTAETKLPRLPVSSSSEQWVSLFLSAVRPYPDGRSPAPPSVNFGRELNTTHRSKDGRGTTFYGMLLLHHTGLDRRPFPHEPRREFCLRCVFSSFRCVQNGEPFTREPRRVFYPRRVFFILLRRVQ